MKNLLVLLLAFGILFGGTERQKEQLTDAEKASAISNYVVPTPDEIFSALESVKSPQWSKFVRINKKTSYTEVHKQCLNLGVTVADLTIAIKSENPKLISQASEKILAYASYLGFSSDIRPAINEIKTLSEKGNWDGLMDKINSLQTTVTEVLSELESGDQIILISLGGWLEGLRVVTASLKKDYQAEATDILRITSQIDYFIQQVNALNPDFATQPDVISLKKKLPEIAQLCQIGKDEHLSKDTIKDLNNITAKLIKQFQK